ncbi:MAG: YeeE/YedE family protein [Proteobacteria bacterium]|nr:YeeE/YedE family protein [Pseudomonadota bacterium]
MENFTPVSAAIGGALIGGAASLLMLFTGRIAGISGIVGNLLQSSAGENSWRIAFVVGLIAGPLAYDAATRAPLTIAIEAPLPVLIAGGLLVGFGTRLGSGCTSGHGVCGLARFSTRSLVATLTFLAIAALTVFVAGHLVGA